MPSSARPGPLIRCPICETPLIDRDDYLNHLSSAHPSYAAWGRKNARNAFIEIVVITSIALVSDTVFPDNIWVAVLGAIGFAAVVVITISYTLVVRRRFRRASKDQNPEDAKLNTC